MSGDIDFTIITITIIITTMDTNLAMPVATQDGPACQYSASL